MLSAALLDSITIIAKAKQRKRNAVDFARSIGFEPDEWQADLLMSEAPCVQVNCSRQSGKTSTTGILAAHGALAVDGLQTVILAPGMRQGSILMQKIKWAMRRADWPVKPRINNEFEVRLENDSGLLVLPGSEETSRGVSGIDRLIVEEASRVEDELYFAMLPILATRPKAREFQLSTPFGTRGFFYERNKLIRGGKAPRWQYFEVPADKCPRITQEFLDDARARMGDWWFQQEFFCRFMDAIDSAFRAADIERMLDSEMESWQLTLTA